VCCNDHPPCSIHEVAAHLPGMGTQLTTLTQRLALQGSSPENSFQPPDCLALCKNCHYPGITASCLALCRHCQIPNYCNQVLISWPFAGTANSKLLQPGADCLALCRHCQLSTLPCQLLFAWPYRRCQLPDFHSHLIAQICTKLLINCLALCRYPSIHESRAGAADL